MRCQEHLHIKAQGVLDNYKGCRGKAYRPQQETSQRRIRRDIPKGYQGEEG